MTEPNERARLAVVAAALAALVGGGCLEANRAPAAATDTGTTAADTTSPADTAQPTDTRPGDTADTGGSACSPGATACLADHTASLTCQNGRWVQEDCASGWVCLEQGTAQCVKASGNQTCDEVFFCLISCDGDQEARDICSRDCFLDGTTEGQREVLDLIDCYEAGQCGDDLGCIDQLCGLPLAACFFETTGPDTCSEILNCTVRCGNDEVCKAACPESGKPGAQAHYATLTLCILTYCGLDPAATCAVTAVANPTQCKSYYDNCTGE